MSTSEVGVDPERRVWRGMIHRATDRGPASHRKNYFDRGITVDPSWLIYANFRRDMGPRPSPAHTLERIDNDGNYEPGNCRWATRQEQNRNRRSNRLLDFDGARRTVAEWSERTGLRAATIHYRLKIGWTIAKALTTSVDANRSDHARGIATASANYIGSVVDGAEVLATLPGDESMWSVRCACGAVFPVRGPRLERAVAYANGRRAAPSHVRCVKCTGQVRGRHFLGSASGRNASSAAVQRRLHLEHQETS